MSAMRTSELQVCINRLRDGDDSMRSVLLSSACERLRLLTRKMLQSYPGIRRWEESDDVLQNVLLRLQRTLHEVHIENAQDFLRLAAFHIRNECIDLCRHYFGPQGLGANYATPPPGGQIPGTAQLVRAATSSSGPDVMATWGEFHEHVGSLPDKDRQLFDLLWYQGVTQQEAAGLLGISLSTLKRRWQAARIRLYESLGGELPL